MNSPSPLIVILGYKQGRGYSYHKEEMSGYVFPCKTNGQCRQLLMEESGIRIPFYVSHGTKRIFGVKFNCCTQCHLPVSKREAERLNKELGYTLDDIEIDSDFLDILHGIE